MMQMTENPIPTAINYKENLLDLVIKKSRCLASVQVYLVVQMMSPRIQFLLVLPFFDFVFRFYKSGFHTVPGPPLSVVKCL